VLPSLGAALLWIPLTLTALWLARRFPLPAERWWLSAGVHALAALSASFVLNLAFFAGEAVLPGGRLPAAGLLAAAGIAGLRFLHINAGVYLGIVALSWMWAARRRPAEPPDAAPTGGAEPYARRLRAATAGRVTLLEVDDIEWIEADGDYARVHVDGADHLVSERMKQLEERLDPARFVRIHRSRIVNVERVRELRHLSHGDYEVTLANDVSLRVSRGRRKQLLDAVERAR
jgi:two-component system LytT family response regulator